MHYGVVEDSNNSRLVDTDLPTASSLNSNLGSLINHGPADRISKLDSSLGSMIIGSPAVSNSNLESSLELRPVYEPKASRA